MTNGRTNDNLYLAAASIGDGRCSGLSQPDIWAGASYSEIRPNGNVVEAGTAQATGVFDLAEVDLNTGAGRTSV